MTNTFDVRSAIPADAEMIKQFALDNNMFELDEIAVFDEMLSGFFDGTLGDHSWIVATADDGGVVSAAYFAPEPFADRMWNLYFIATEPSRHGDGSGTTLIEYIEAQLRRRGHDVALTLIVDTSSSDEYAQTRAFYEKRGFVEESRIRDFFGPGDAKVTFWKSLIG